MPEAWHRGSGSLGPNSQPMPVTGKSTAVHLKPKPPPLVKGEGAIAFGGGAVLTDAGRELLKEVDAVQLTA